MRDSYDEGIEAAAGWHDKMADKIIADIDPKAAAGIRTRANALQAAVVHRFYAANLRALKLSEQPVDEELRA